MGAGRSYLWGQEYTEGLASARAWRIRMKPYFDALYGAEEKGKSDLRQGITPAAHAVLDMLDEARPRWLRAPAGRADHINNVRAMLEPAGRLPDAVMIDCVLASAAHLIFCAEQMLAFRAQESAAA
ncbi:hypothetical protein [Novosphingobium huizhouense]|uniref:hypothetical protein n=1 Tax=Novosphingobium huizhouense TaxID=2866625 RepID=UPI001CD8304D|nr:hypothetical protein [Novosphingobium huizhouense]